MKKTHLTVSLAVSLVMAMAMPLLPGNSGISSLGVDVVSAATAEAPATPTTTPSKPSTPVSTPVKTTTSWGTVTTTRLMALGSRGDDVKQLQTMLNSAGYSLKVDGIFGNLTVAAVKDYQQIHSLMADGVVGPKTLASLNAAAPTVSSQKIYQGLGHTVVFRNGPGKDSTGVPVYSFTVVMANVDFDANGKILSAYLDAYEVATPNYDGASMPHFSGWPDMQGYNVTNHETEAVTPGTKLTFDSIAAEVNGWKTKRQRGDTYGMNKANEWYKQMDFYQKFFVGKTVAELNDWFAKNTTAAGRPIKSNTTVPEDIAKLAKLSDKEKSDLVDVVSGATMSLKDGHGDFLGAVADAYNNRVETTISAK